MSTDVLIRQAAITAQQLRETARMLNLQADALEAGLPGIQRSPKKVKLIVPWEENHGTAKKGNRPSRRRS